MSKKAEVMDCDQENRFAGFDVTAQAVHTDTDHGTETGTVR